MLTAAVVRDERVRGAFEVIGWVGLSQAPDLKALQSRLFEQLTDGNKMPKKADSIELQTGQLQKVASKRLVLIVLDGKLLLRIINTPAA